MGLIQGKWPLRLGFRGLICSTKIINVKFPTKLLNTPRTSDIGKLLFLVAISSNIKPKRGKLCHPQKNNWSTTFQKAEIRIFFFAFSTRIRVQYPVMLRKVEHFLHSVISENREKIEFKNRLEFIFGGSVRV